MLKISIVTAVFNRVDTVTQALDSVNSQSWPAVEHIVVDGVSTDGTLQVLEAHRDVVAVLLSEPDNGIYEALNKGLALATGDLIGLMHSDDFYAGDRVLEQVANAFADSSVDGVYGDLDYVDKNDTSRVVRHWRAGKYDRAKIAWGWMPPHPALFLRRSVIERWGGFDTNHHLRFGFMPVDSVARLRIGSPPGIKRWLKESVNLHMPSGFRTFVYFLYRYIIRFGFLDGRVGTQFHILQGFCYRFLVDAKVDEVRRYMADHRCDAVTAIEQVLDIKLPSQANQP